MKSSCLFSIITIVWLLHSLAYSQDLIILKNGSEIKSKVTEVGLSEIRYKKFDNLDGPNIVITSTDVIMIRYENGTNHVITPQAASNLNEVAPVDKKSTENQNPIEYPTVREKKYQNTRKREPGLAILCSILLPGGGQYYNKEIGKGVAMTASSIAGWIMVGLGFGDIDDGIDWDGNYYWNGYNEGLVAAGFVLGIGASLWSIIDAPIMAKKINERYGLSLKLKVQKVPDLGLSESHLVYGLQVVHNF